MPQFIKDSVDYIIDRINTVEINNNPFPHVVIDDYLPPAFYDLIMSTFPAKEEMCNPYNKVRTYENVWQLDIVADPFVRGSADDAWRYTRKLQPGTTFEMCQLVEQVIFGPELTEAWRKKFSLPATDLIQVGRLAIDGYDAGLGPHVDREDKCISNVLYLAKGDEPADLCGTHLLKPKDEMIQQALSGTTDHQTYDSFVVTNTVGYIPNRLIGWKVVPESWHAYHQTYNGDRRTIKFFIQQDIHDYETLRAEKDNSTIDSQDWRSTDVVKV